MILKNGRGQLGDELSKHKCDLDWIVYHTWNIVDLTNEDIQNNEFAKFKQVVDDNKDKKICFVSTTYDKDTVYLYNKIKAEVYLIDNVKDWKIIRLPHFLGKGLFSAFRDGELPWDNSLVDVISLENACVEIIKHLCSDKKFVHVPGEFVSKTMICSLIQYGVKND